MTLHTTFSAQDASAGYPLRESRCIGQHLEGPHPQEAPQAAEASEKKSEKMARTPEEITKDRNQHKTERDQKERNDREDEQAKLREIEGQMDRAKSRPATGRAERKPESEMTPEEARQFWIKHSELAQVTGQAEDELSLARSPSKPTILARLASIEKALQEQRQHLLSGRENLPSEDQAQLDKSIMRLNQKLRVIRGSIREYSENQQRSSNERDYGNLKGRLEMRIRRYEQRAKKTDDAPSAQRDQQAAEISRQLLQELESAHTIQDVNDQHHAIEQVREDWKAEFARLFPI